MSMFIPERNLQPGEVCPIIAGCSHEVYPADYYDPQEDEELLPFIFEWSDGGLDSETLCPACFRQKLNAMSLFEFAELMSSEYTRVRHLRR